ncbi:hypothetical protein [Microbispora triticiradicis]|uniref:hypothetical protein n=1 Tax=Microbispora triticiradicis TaxID=2200763 RepID=UPI001AD73140|nr:hypothetical protein [Microbispora triticiradicis]MBO4271327.1 hypothetical protein [Microbispora triticiradicis]
MLHNRWIRWGAIAFVAFMLFTRPTQSAHTVKAGFDKATTGVDRAATFVTALTK